MTLTDAANRACLLGLIAYADADFCILRHPSGSLAARGGTWEEAFARLESAQASARERAAQRAAEPPAEPPPGSLF